MKWYWLKKNIYLSDEDLKNKIKESLSMEVSDASLSNVTSYFSNKLYEIDFIDKKIKENDFIVNNNNGGLSFDAVASKSENGFPKLFLNEEN